jgi:hypothetical protein
MAVDEDGVRLYRNDSRSNHEYFSLRLVDAGSGALLSNCDIYVKFEEGRAWATTSSANSALGFDHWACLFVNPAETHSRDIEISVVWPDGGISRFGIDDIALSGMTILSRPELVSSSVVQEPVEAEVELSAAISNAPNPFNPSTTLNYTVPAAGEIHLQIFNLLGQEVALLASGYTDAGVYTAHFDAHALPSGLYIARLQTATATTLHRMLLTK